ncbi:MAG: cold shock domain-containing protein [Actinomadura rubrobrunea]|nr:cold shock domain-containing protein [Actinomadura rubrobrunea]
MARSGRILRFDDVRGYGFIAPDGGGEDVFVHANDLLEDKSLFTPGTHVTFEVTEGERGLKAFAVQTVARPFPATGPATSSTRDHDADDDVCDVLSVAEFSQEITEALLAGASTLTGQQILQVRRTITELAVKHGWVEA